MYGIWFRRVVAYDGLLPLMVWFTPWLASLAFPNRRGLIEMFAILLPVIGFLIRYVSGRRLIDENACSNIEQRWQFVSLCVGLMVLAVIDCVIVLLYVMPRGALQKPGDWLMFLILWVFYFSLMAGAMYPGRGR